MSNSFRIDATEIEGWRSALAARMELRGVPAIAKEMEAHLARRDPDGAVIVTRHQLFTWAEALQGASARDPNGGVPGLIAEMRAILTGKGAGGGAGVGVGSAKSGLVVGTPAPAPAPTSLYSRAPAPPAVTYASQARTGAGAQVVSGAELAQAVRDTIHMSTRDLYVASPWVTGVETLIEDVTKLPNDIRVMILSRRPERDEPAFHQAMDKLGRRKAITAWSQHIQTRVIIADDARAIVGAASIPGPASREIGVIITDPATVAALRAHFERAHLEAAGGKY